MSIVEQLMDGADRLLDKTMVLNASRVGYMLREPAWDPADTWVSMHGKVCLVTAATAGHRHRRACDAPRLRTPEQGADTLLWLAVNPRLTERDGGRFWFDRRARLTHRLGFGCSSEAERESFWQLCRRLAGCLPETAAVH